MQYPPGTATGDALEDALSEPKRYIHTEVLIDWNRDGLFDHTYSDVTDIVSEVTDERQVSGDSPDNVLLTTGFASAEMTVVLEGQRFHDEFPAWKLFSPYVVTSPLYGLRIPGTPIIYNRIVRTAIGDVRIRQFTGWVRSFDIRRREGKVTLVCSDVIDINAAKVTLPHWAIQPATYAAPGDGGGVAAGGIAGSLSWVVEETLRQGGRPSGPEARSEAVAYFSGNGMFLPSVGNIAWVYDGMDVVRHQLAAVDGVYQWKDGQYGLCAVPLEAPYTTARSNRCKANASELVTVPANGSGGPTKKVGLSFWFESRSGASTGLSSASSLVCFLDDWWTGGRDNCGYIGLAVESNGKISAWVSEDNTLSTPRTWIETYPETYSPPGWHYVNVIVSFNSSSISFETRVDDAIIFPVTSSLPAFGFRYKTLPPAFRPNLVEISSRSTCIQHAQVYHGGSTLAYVPGQQDPPTTNDGVPWSLPFSTLSELAWIPDVYQDNPWEVLQEVIKGDFGIMHTTEWGQIVALSQPNARQDALDQSVGNPPILDDDRLVDLVVNPTIDNYANQISIGTQWRYVNQLHVYSNQGARDFYAGPNETKSQTLGLDDVMLLDTKIAGLPAVKPDNGSDITISSVSAVRADDVNTGIALVGGSGPGITVDPRYPDPTRPDARNVLFTWWSETGHPAVYMGSYIGGNEGSLRLAGLKYSDIVTVRNVYQDSAEVALFGTRTVILPDNVWRQTVGTNEVTANNLLAETVNPAPLIDSVTVPADPRRQLRDVVALKGSGVTGKVFAQIIGITREDSESGSSDTLTLRVILSLNTWRLEDEDLSQLGTTTTLS